MRSDFVWILLMYIVSRELEMRSDFVWIFKWILYPDNWRGAMRILISCEYFKCISYRQLETIGDEERFRMNIVNVYCIQTIGDEEWFRMNIVKCIFYPDNWRWGVISYGYLNVYCIQTIGDEEWFRMNI